MDNTTITITKQADFTDIYNELVKRKIIIEKPVWTTRQGKTIPVSELTDSHLLNIYHMLKKQMEEEDILDHVGDVDPLDYYD